MVRIKKEKLLIQPEHIKPSTEDFEVLGVLNPAAVRLPDNKIMLYLRVIEKLKTTEDKKYLYSPRMIGKKKFKVKIDKIDKKKVKEYTDLDMIFEDGTKRLTFISHLRRAIVDESGFNLLSLEQVPGFYGIASDSELGVEDARITKINNRYIMTYVSLTRDHNIATSLAISKDCMNWERQGIIFGEQDKDVVIFPEKIKGKYVAFDRPEGNFQFTTAHIWIAYSRDLKSWGNLKSVPCIYKEKGVCPRNGAGPPPIKTKKGWLLLYHVVSLSDKITRTRHLKKEPHDNIIKKIIGIRKTKICYEKTIDKITTYGVGAALFDLKNPERIIAKSPSMIIKPKKSYEIGTFENKEVVFPSGLVIDKNNKDILIYSGGGDQVTTVKKISLANIIKSLRYVK
ncbi:hypothetical protein GF386_03760 [Candidatus Pacearchaeota archaeon]|nr:hypothetical protein [Candidatus Pacearchaeota archaeon]MBD3283268.1 hypothetical protein [Candidatus Pacearchaeota archaeon]